MTFRVSEVEVDPTLLTDPWYLLRLYQQRKRATTTTVDDLLLLYRDEVQELKHQAVVPERNRASGHDQAGGEAGALATSTTTTEVEWEALFGQVNRDRRLKASLDESLKSSMESLDNITNENESLTRTLELLQREVDALHAESETLTALFAAERRHAMSSRHLLQSLVPQADYSYVVFDPRKRGAIRQQLGGGHRTVLDGAQEINAGAGATQVGQGDKSSAESTEEQDIPAVPASAPSWFQEDGVSDGDQLGRALRKMDRKLAEILIRRGADGHQDAVPVPWKLWRAIRRPR
ncbi:unnamed protein product [Amoebophrya sp. A120]|nr:unnamed protein product [Amoebophrya sp. A120]|eukprot:GSA120T00002518001.1